MAFTGLEVGQLRIPDVVTPISWSALWGLSVALLLMGVLSSVWGADAAVAVGSLVGAEGAGDDVEDTGPPSWVAQAVLGIVVILALFGTVVFVVSRMVALRRK